MLAFAPGERHVEIDAVKEPRSPGTPPPGAALDVAVVLGRGGFGADPVP